MKIRGIKKLIVAIAFLGTLSTLTSCNRGIGCPSDFSLEQVVVKVVNGIVTIID